MDNTTYYQRNREIMLNRAKNYYEFDKERLRVALLNKYRNLSEDKKKKREYGKNRYHNMSEKKKQELIKTKKSKSKKASE